MIAELDEYDGCFSLELTPENMEESISLIRLGINKTKELRGIFVEANRDNTLRASIVLGKKKNSTTKVE